MKKVVCCPGGDGVKYNTLLSNEGAVESLFTSSALDAVGVVESCEVRESLRMLVEDGF